MLCIALCGAAAGGTLAVAASIAPRPLTPADAVATTRFMPIGPNSREFVSISPDRQRYVIRLVHGDPEKNGIWIDLLSGGLQSLKEAVPTTVAHLFSTGLGVVGYGGPVADGLAFKSSPLRWIDNRRVALLLSDEHDARQIVTVDSRSGRTVAETELPGQKYAFDIALNGTIVYVADLPLPPKLPPPTGGFVVPEGTDAYEIADGYFDGSTINTRSARAVWFLKRLSGPAVPVSFPGHRINRGYPYRQQVSMSPDGSRAILSAPAGSVPLEWDGYLGRTQYFDMYPDREKFAAARSDPTGVDARQIMQLYVLDVDSGVATPLWDAPGPKSSWSSSWSSGGRYVVLTPIPIPIAEQSDSRHDLQTVVFDTVAGKHWIIPVSVQALRRITWIGGKEVLMEVPKEPPACFGMVHDGWESQACRKSPILEARSSPIEVRVKEDLNTPPRLFALDRHSGVERVVLDPNPGLKSTFELGKVEFLQGNLRTGEEWRATLTLPVHYLPGEPYPLVIQNTGGSSTLGGFSLYGMEGETGLGPSFIATYAAQTLAGRGIAVLTFGVQNSVQENSGGIGAGPADPDTRQRAFEEIVGKLVADHIADQNRIGINGFSRAGFYAIHTLSHSHLRFAAAVVADNVDYSYVQVVLGDRYREAESLIGAPAFGAGLKTWLDRATGFNVDAIHTPLLLVGETGGARANILGQWEILSLLRRLKRPVEMYLMPDIEAHPSHNPQNPEQVMAVQERAVDWFDFWLNGHEVPGAAKAAQYERWRALKAQQTAAGEAAPVQTLSEAVP
jgi:hypothetical protein